MFLSDAEIAEMCAPLKAAAAQKKYLRGLGLVVNEKPNGRPLVVRSHAEAVLSGRAAAEVELNIQRRPVTGDGAALLELFGRKKRVKRLAGK